MYTFLVNVVARDHVLTRHSPPRCSKTDLPSRLLRFGDSLFVMN